jgi:outer membrane receptor protein involved in Fe transport
MHDRVRLIAAVGLLAVLGPARLYAQAATATILGTVTDASGAAVLEASVHVRNVGTSVMQSTVTDGQGRYNAPDLGVGEYEVQASKTGFSTVVHRGITLTVGAQVVVDFSLPVGQQSQTVTVEGQVSQVQTTNAALSSLISTQQMEQLPLNGRNFEQLIFLSPGVSLINTMAPNARQGRAAVPSAAGARPEGYVILQDDESINNFFNRGIGTITGTSLGMEAMAEFQTLTNTYGAQFGGNGAVVNAVSKSGTNGFHGSAYGYLRNSALDARGFFDPAIIPFRRFQPGGSLGGPIKKDKMFFFVNYEGIWQLLAQTRIATVPNAASRTPSFPRATNPTTYDAIVKTLAIYPMPTFNFRPIPGTSLGTGQATEVASQTAHEHYFLGRFDYTVSAKDSFLARYFFDKQHVFDPYTGGNGNAASGFLPFWPERDEGFDHFATVEWRRVISPALLHTARVSFSRPNTADYEVNSFPALQFFPGAGRPDADVGITGLTTLGQSFFVPAGELQNKFTEADDLVWIKGSHTLHMGASVVRLDSNVFYPFRSGSVWTFQSLSNFLSGVALSVTGTPVGPQYYHNRDYRETDFTPYVQDDWKATSRLTLNLGLRWDFTTNPIARHNTFFTVTDYLHDTGLVNVPHANKDNPSWWNLDPRLGFAYDIFGDHKTSLRGGFAINHSQIFPAQYNPMYTAVKPWDSFTASNPVYPIPDFSHSSASTTISPGWDYYIHKAPYLIQYNLNVQRQIFESTVLTVGYVGSHGVDLITQQEKNPPTPVFDANGVPHFAALVNGRIVGNPRLNPALGFLQMAVSGTTSRYNSIEVSLDRRFSRNVQAQVNYTFSRCIDDGGSPLGSINGGNSPSNYENPYDRSNYDRGLCYFNSTHNFRANGLVSLPFHGNRAVEGWQLTSIVTWNIGLPLSVADGIDQAGFGYVPTGAPRPNYVPGCSVNLHQVNEWFNPACFAIGAPGTFGNVGRNTIIGPGLAQVDFAVLKDTRIRESWRVQFRAEFFNISNHPQFGQPNTSLFTAGAAGACTASGAGCGVLSPTAGQITTLATNTAARQIQFAVKVIF